MGVPFKKGHDDRRGKGGARPGAGRKPNWLKEYCDKILSSKKLIETKARIAAGQPIIVRYKDPETKKKLTVVRIPAIDDIQEAIDWFADRAHGKATQAVEHSGNINNLPFDIVVRRAIPGKDIPK